MNVTSPLPSAVLVSDFDGTITRQDFYRVAIDSLVPPGTPNHWADYRRGAISHFEGLRRYFATIRESEQRVLELVDGMGLDPRMPTVVANLRAAGWSVIVASAGCEWYIQRLLAKAGVAVEVHANRGRFVEGQGLLMELPTDSPYLCMNLGIDKAGIVRRHLEAGCTVAFAGDGYPDAAAARLVPAEYRFARADLAEVLRSEGLAFRPFEAWSEIADALLAGR